MDRRYTWGVFWAVLFGSVLLSGCGGGSSSTTLLSITTTALPNGTVGAPYTATLQATGGTSPYSWSQTSGGDMPGGIILNSAGMFSGTPTTAGTFGPYVFKVTDSANNQVPSASLSITISGAVLAVTTTSLSNGTVGMAYSVTLSATGGASPYTWAETSGGALPAGLTFSNGVISGTPTAAGTFGPYVFTVTDSKSATAASASLSLTVNGTAAEVCPSQGNEAALTSANPYAFLLKGTDSKSNPIYIAGSFTPNGAGGIANAVADYNGLSDGPEPLQVDLAASSYSFNTSAQGCLYLSFSGLASAAVANVTSEGPKASVSSAGRTARPNIVAVPVANVQFSFYLSGLSTGVYNTGRIIEADYATSKTSASGFIHVQTPAAFAMTALQTNYAFGVDGWTITAPGVLRTAMAGTFTNTTGVLSAIYADVDTGGNASGELTNATGGGSNLASTIDSTTGRGTGTLYLTTPTGPLTYDFVFYILNGSDLILLSTDLPQTITTPLLVGRALASSTNYPATPLSGYYLLASQGYQSIGASIGNTAQIGTLNATSAGNIPTATIYSNLAGTFATNQYPGSSYTVEAASGRVTITGILSNSPVVYLTNSTPDDGIAGFLVGTDPQASSGVMVSQTASTPNYGVANVAGNYAASTEEDADGKNGAFLGLFNFSGTGAYTVTPTPITTGTVPTIPSSGSILVNTDGSGNLDGGNFPLVTNGQFLFVIPNSGDPLLFVFTQ
jgi:hypothetical protein